MATVTVFLRVKHGDKYPYYRASVAGNGRIEPFVAIVNDRRKTFNEGTYYIGFTGPDGRQKCERAGKDPAVARARQIAKQAELDARASGVAVEVIDPALKSGTSITQQRWLADRIAKRMRGARRHETGSRRCASKLS